MKTKAQYRNWMAENIAKTYLLGSEMLDLAEPSNGTTNDFDFIAIPKNAINKTLPIEVKSLKSSKIEISRFYKNIREDILKKDYPVMVFYIDAMERTGFVELIDKKLSNDLSPLNMDNVKNLLNQVNCVPQNQLV